MKIFDYLERAIEIFTEILLALMAIIVFFNVVSRYAFDKAYPWTEEIAVFMFVWVIFLGALLAFKRHRHLGIDLLINILPNAGKKAVAFLGNLIVGGILMVMLDGGIKFFFQTVGWPAPGTHIPYGYVNAIVMFVVAIMLLLLLKDMVELFKSDSTDGKGGKS